MGAAFAVVFTFIIVAFGMEALRNKVAGVFSNKQAKDGGFKLDPKLEHDMTLWVRALKNDGYFGEVKSIEITYVDDKVLTDMANTLAVRYDLPWILPHFRMRVKPTPNEAPVEFKAKHPWVVMTPTHAIGYGGPV